MRLRNSLWSFAFLAACGSGWLRGAEEPKTIPAEQFDKLHKMIKPQPGELRFHEISWFLSIWEARKQAAAEGKPILVWSGSGGAPVGSC
jgi:hypothetical protein